MPAKVIGKSSGNGIAVHENNWTGPAGTISIVTAEDLIAMKLFAGGAQDLEDVRGILYVSGQRLNRELLKSLVEPYGPDVARQLEDLSSSDEL